MLRFLLAPPRFSPLVTRFAALTALAVAVFPTPAARCDLLLPPAARESAHAPLWRRVFERIPAALRPARDVVVNEVSDAEMDLLVNEDQDQASRQDDSLVDGMFLIDEDGQATITLRRSLKRAESEQVFAHELGHLIWDTHLTSGQRREYNDVYKRARSARRLVTGYAGESVEEGFAEALSFYVLRPETLRRRDPLSFALLEDLSRRRP